MLMSAWSWPKSHGALPGPARKRFERCQNKIFRMGIEWIARCGLHSSVAVKKRIFISDEILVQTAWGLAAGI